MSTWTIQKTSVDWFWLVIYPTCFSGGWLSIVRKAIFTSAVWWDEAICSYLVSRDPGWSQSAVMLQSMRHDASAVFNGVLLVCQFCQKGHSWKFHAEIGHTLRCGAIVKKIGPLHWRTLSTLLSNLERISLFSNALTSVNNSLKPDIEVFSGCSWLIRPWSTPVIMLLGGQPMISIFLWGKWWQSTGFWGFSMVFPSEKRRGSLCCFLYFLPQVPAGNDVQRRVTHSSDSSLHVQYMIVYVKMIGPQSWMLYF